jgi:hypothetical protein
MAYFSSVMQKGKRTVRWNPIILRHLCIAIAMLLCARTMAQPTKWMGDSTTVSIAPDYDDVSAIHRFFLGESYRKLWAAPVKLKVFYLQQEGGGMQIIQKGGGLQTQSLRLLDSAGKSWVLRTVQKYPERNMPANLRATVAKDILQDQVVTAHPFASLTVPPLATALGIPHANPQIVYVPDDTALGIYRKDFANAVFLLEEREPLDADRTDNTEKTQRKLEEDNDVTVNEKIVLRARLLDMLLGDWDRHEDQWRWDRKKEDKTVVYTPVPRDRDQVYYNTTGVLPWIVSHQWLMSKFQGFHEHIRDINGFNLNARYFDRYFLTSLNANDWGEQINYIENTLSDSIIIAAVKLMPDTIYTLSGEKITRTLITRRNNLRKEAMKYYSFLAKNVDIHGSDKHELFLINKQPQGEIGVQIFKTKKDGTVDKLVYDRVFNPVVTKEIRLYGLAGNDGFKVNGNNKSPIKIRLIGGENADSFYIASDVKNSNKIYVYDRADEKNILPEKGLFKNHTSTDTLVNEYNKKSFVFDRFGPLFAAQYNPDLGLLVKASVLLEKQGFRKTPYAQNQQLSVSYYTGRESFLLQYEADFKKVLGNTNASINILSRGPKNQSNFYGIGNETKFIHNDDTGIHYYRNRYDLINGDFRLCNNIQQLKLYAGIAAQYYYSSEHDNERRFLNSYNKTHSAEQIFKNQFFAGLAAGAELDTRNRGILTYKGFHWTLDFAGMRQITGQHKTYGRITSSASVHVPLFNDSNYVIAARIAGGTVMGEPAYYQMMQLGGAQILRGFRSNRFTGKTMLYNNIELRAKLFDFTSYLLPGSVGIIAFSDLGRVWQPGEKSKQWHHGYGGGFYFIPAQLFLLQTTVGVSGEGALTYITLGFRF